MAYCLWRAHGTVAGNYKNRNQKAGIGLNPSPTHVLAHEGLEDGGELLLLAAGLERQPQIAVSSLPGWTGPCFLSYVRTTQIFH
ncbi:MAG: hypothetical protein V7638_4541 [Acidobacteriota bacterium]